MTRVSELVVSICNLSANHGVSRQIGKAEHLTELITTQVCCIYSYEWLFHIFLIKRVSSYFL